MTKPHLVSTRGDHDPEDEYNALDNPVQARRLKERPVYRKHLGQVGSSSVKHQSALLEESFKDGKYEGRVVSRRDLDSLGIGSLDRDGTDASEGTDTDIDDIDSDSDTDTRTDTKDDEMEQFVREMNDLKKLEQKGLKLIQQQRVSDKTRGEHVRNQMAAWESLLEVEMRVHDLLQLVTKPVSDRRVIKEINNIGRMLQSFAEQEGCTEQDLWTTGKSQLVKWHQQAIASTMTTANKQGLTALARDPWTFVEDAWHSDRARLLKKARPTENAYDDSDFHRLLLKEWTRFRSSDGVAFLAVNHVNQKHRQIVGRVSKGRRLCHEVQPKLLAYMMPVGDTKEWADDKVDDLVKSLFCS